MNFLRITLLSSMLCCSAAHAMENPLGEEQARQGLVQWAEQKNEQLIALNGGFAPDDLNHGIILFIREHAEQIGNEIEYIIDNCNAQEAALFRAAADTFLTNYTAHMLPLLTSAKMVSESDFAAVHADMFQLWNAIKIFISNNAPLEECPLIRKALAQLPLLEDIATEGIEFYKKNIKTGDKENILPLALDREQVQQSFTMLKSELSIIEAHMKTEEHKNLLKNVVHAWVAFMKEDAFFAAVQHNKTIINSGNADEQQPLNMPESLLKLMVAGNTYAESFQKAIFAAEYAQYAAILAEQGIDIEQLAAEALAQAQAEDATSEPLEYDFNASFEQRHKA